MKLVRILLVILENKWITWVELIQRGRGDRALILGMILSRVCLLILPISDLEGLISLIEGLQRKSGLWSLRVKKGVRGEKGSVRSHTSRLVAICSPALLMLSNV